MIHKEDWLSLLALAFVRMWKSRSFRTVCVTQKREAQRFCTNVFHGEPPAGLKVGLWCLHRTRREGHISPDHGLLYRGLANVGGRYWWSSFLHLDAWVHIGWLAGWCPAIHRPGHWRWAWHLRNVVLGGLVGGWQRSGHGRSRPSWAKRWLPLIDVAGPLTLVVHALVWRHHLVWTVHSMVARALAWYRRPLSVWIARVTHFIAALPHWALGPIGTWRHGACHHLGRHWRLGVGACRWWSSFSPEGERELILWAWGSAVPTRVCIILVIHILLALGPRGLGSWLLLTTVGNVIQFSLMALGWRTIPSIHWALVVLPEDKFQCYEQKLNITRLWIYEHNVFTGCCWGYIPGCWFWYGPPGGAPWPGNWLL